MCGIVADIDWDGVNEIVIGTYGKRLLIYKCTMVIGECNSGTLSTCSGIIIKPVLILSMCTRFHTEPWTSVLRCPDFSNAGMNAAGVCTAPETYL